MESLEIRIDKDSYFVVTGFEQREGWNAQINTVLCKLAVYSNGTKPKSKNLSERSYDLSRALKVTMDTLKINRASEVKEVEDRYADVIAGLYPDSIEEVEEEAEDFFSSSAGEGGTGLLRGA
jgi:hypothetical protein